MTRLNDQFMEVLTNTDGGLRLTPNGYNFMQHEQDGEVVDIRFNPWMEPTISIRGVLQAGVLKGGISLNSERTSFEKGGIHQPGLHIGFDDAYGDRRYWIADSDNEEVQISFWDPNANTPNPDDGSLGGQYRGYSLVPEEDAEVVKKIASGIIEAGKIAVASELASS